MSALDKMVQDKFQYYDKATQKKAEAELAHLKAVYEAAWHLIEKHGGEDMLWELEKLLTK